MTEPEIKVVTFGIEFYATPEGQYRMDRLERTHDDAMSALDPRTRDALEEAERRFLFGARDLVVSGFDIAVDPDPF